MKSEEELKKARGRLTEAEMATIRSLKGTLEMFEKDPSITMIKMREMQNFYNTVRVLKDGYIEKIINLLKEGTKLD
jgi:ribonucleotide reductase alpha subunit